MYIKNVVLNFASTGQSEIRVVKDDAPVESTEYNDREVADSDKQLGMHNFHSILRTPINDL